MLYNYVLWISVDLRNQGNRMKEDFQSKEDELQAKCDEFKRHMDFFLHEISQLTTASRGLKRGK